MALVLSSLCFLFPFIAGAEPVNIRVGIYENSPKVFTDADGTPRGIFVDILNDIARKENWNLEYVNGTFADHLKSLENHDIDMLVDVSYSTERAERFTLSNAPVLESWLDVFSRREVHIGSIRDLDNKRIAVLKGSIQESYLNTVIKQTYGIDFTLLPYDDYPDSNAAVESGEADVMVATRFFYFSPIRSEDILPAHVIFRPENLHFAYPKGYNPDVIATIDRHVAEMHNDPNSAYYASLNQWMNVQPRALVPAYVKYVLAIFAGLLGISGAFALILRRQVAAKTRELKIGNEELVVKNRELDRLNVANLKTNEELRESDLLLKQTQALSRLGGCEYDVGTGRSKWTEEVFRIYGLDPDYDDSDVARNISYCVPEDASVAEKVFRRAVEAGEPYDVELQVIRADGERIWIRTTGQPVWEDGKVVRVSGIVMDITQSKRAELEEEKLHKQLLHAERMELVGRLAGGVAHDFNNMLSVIIGYTELAQRQVDPAGRLGTDLKEIHNAAQRSTNITRQLLAFARKQAAAPQLVDLNRAVEGVLKMLQRLIGEDISLIFHPGEDLWQIRIDPSQIDQILANLCINSRDAIKDVGKITIETKNVVIDDAYSAVHPDFAAGEFVLMSISDDGSGMSPETKEKIFEPYYTTKEIGHGTGLGLATVFGIIKQNHGFINVYSELGQGSAFNIYLPRSARETAMLPAERNETIPHGAGETIMVVEDEASILDLTRRILEGLGYVVLSAASPVQAQRLAGEFPGRIDLLITDVVLPDVNGKDLADRLIALRPEMKCLFMSGYTADVIADHGVLTEGVQFIQKPFSRMDLAARVQEALGSGD